MAVILSCALAGGCAGTYIDDPKVADESADIHKQIGSLTGDTTRSDPRQIFEPPPPLEIPDPVATEAETIEPDAEANCWGNHFAKIVSEDTDPSSGRRLSGPGTQSGMTIGCKNKYGNMYGDVWTTDPFDPNHYNEFREQIVTFGQIISFGDYNVGIEASLREIQQQGRYAQGPSYIPGIQGTVGKQIENGRLYAWAGGDRSVETGENGYSIGTGGRQDFPDILPGGIKAGIEGYVGYEFGPYYGNGVAAKIGADINFFLTPDIQVTPFVDTYVSRGEREPKGELKPTVVPGIEVDIPVSDGVSIAPYVKAYMDPDTGWIPDPVYGFTVERRF